VVRDIGVGPLQQGSTLDSITSFLMSPRARVNLVHSSLSSQLSFLENTLAEKGSPEETKIWVKAVLGGSQFLDSVSGTYVSYLSVISKVKDFISNLGLFVGGATTFITLPYDLAKNLVITLNDAIEQMCCVTNVPHEIVRSFRNIICSIVALPKSLFIGFTNPELFEGASNCGTTLGIPEAAVSAFSNSFSATAQVPSQRKMSQYFQTPASVLSISEEPLQVTGVFLATDVERTGLNYLASYAGSKITLSSIPSMPIVVDYMVQQSTTQNMIQLETASAYIVKSGDTPIRIASNVYDDPTQWKNIVLYNALEYPYIEEDLLFKKEVFATGIVQFYRTFGYFGAVVIPKGTSVYVPENMGTLQIDFLTSEDSILDLMQDYVDVPVVAVLSGGIGNIASGLITGFSPITGIGRVSNMYPTLGGRIWNVAKVGDIIQIPRTSKQNISAVIPASIDYNELFGIDIWVNEAGEFDFSVEEETDFARVFGITNLVQALSDRIKTSKGFYPYNIFYGTNLPLYVGKKSIPNWHNLIKVDIKDGVLLDPRISSIADFKMTVDGDIVEMEFDAIPINQQGQIPVSLIV